MLYNSDVVDSWVQQKVASVLVSKQIDDVMAGYDEKTIPYDDAHQCLSAVSEFRNRTLAVAAEEQLQLLEDMETSSAAFEDAEEMYAQGDYLEALDLYTLVSEESETYDNAQERRVECQELYIADVLSKTDGLQTQGEYVAGLKLVSVALDVFPDDEVLLARQDDLQSAYEILVKEDALTDANTFVQSGVYVKAISALEEALEIIPGDIELEGMRISVESAYEDDIRTQVSALVEEGQYDEAISRIKSAAKNVSDSTTLDSFLQDIEREKPVNLSNLTIIDSDEYEHRNEPFIDSYGYKYDCSYWFDASKNAYVIMNLNGEYSVLSGSIVAGSDTGAGAEMDISIYADDQLAYTYTGFTKITGVVDFSIDVAGATKLEIRTSNPGEYYSGFLSLVEAVLYREASEDTGV